MNDARRGRAAWRCLAGSALLWSMAAAPAHATPDEEYALAEKEFARGDLVASLALWTRAAGQGHAPAQARLGDILDKSEEDEDAVAWYRKAAGQGNAAGEFGLGQMYAKGEGVERDLAQALAYVRRAAEKDHPAAAALMMESYRTGGLGLPKDPVQADAWELKVAVLFPGYKKLADPVPTAKEKRRKGGRK